VACHAATAGGDWRRRCFHSASARLVSTQIGNALDSRFVIENRPDVNGIVGTNLAYGSPPDGQTLLFAADEVIQ
jgi:tripartite-type tricarboxylate transporter receptor subunit TctC